MANELQKEAYNWCWGDPEKSLRVWWAKTYDRPIFHESLEDYTTHELYLEYFIRLYSTDASAKCEIEKELGIKHEDSKNEQQALDELEQAYMSGKMQYPLKRK